MKRAGVFLVMMCCGLTSIARGAPTVSIQGAPSRGRSTAKVVVVEYSDFQCPYCGKFARETFATIEERYITPGPVRYVLRHFPLHEAHPKAFKAAEKDGKVRVMKTLSGTQTTESFTSALDRVLAASGSGAAPRR